MRLSTLRHATPQNIAKAQAKALRRQLAYCEKHVPALQGYAANVNQINSSNYLDKLAQLPVLTKNEIRSNPEAYRSKDYLSSSVKASFSSGSTGEPFASYFDSYTWLRKKFYVKLRARMLCGMRFGERVAVLECEPSAILEAQNNPGFFKDKLLKIRMFSVFTPAEQLINELRSFAPQNIYAYPSHLLELAMAMKASNIAIDGVKRMYTSSEFLERGMREQIEQAFQAEVFDHYGSTEFKEIAWECTQHGDYHINNDELICEILKEGKPVFNTPGEVVVTDLRNRAMPLIRYSLGDLGIMTEAPCACGYQGFSMRPLGGRSSDYLMLPSGESMSPFRFTTEIEFIEGLCQYQIVQQPDLNIKVRTVWAPETQTPAVQQVEQVLRAVIAKFASSDLITFDVEVCESISNEDNGKFKVVKRLT